FRHSYEHDLAVDLDQATYTDPEGRVVEIPLPGPGSLEAAGRGYTLRIRDEGAQVLYELARTGKLAMEFVRERTAGAKLRLVRLLSPADQRISGARVDLFYDDRGRLSGMLETSSASVVETRFILDERGHIVEVRRGEYGARELLLVASYGY